MVGTDRPLAVTNQPARILKIDRDGKVVSVLRGPQPGTTFRSATRSLWTRTNSIFNSRSSGLARPEVSLEVVGETEILPNNQKRGLNGMAWSESAFKLRMSSF